MAGIGFFRCSCCGRDFGFNTNNKEVPMRCSRCEHARGLCQHNLSERVARGLKNIAHGSKPCRKTGTCEWIVLQDGSITRYRVERG